MSLFESQSAGDEQGWSFRTIYGEEPVTYFEKLYNVGKLILTQNKIKSESLKN